MDSLLELTVVYEDAGGEWITASVAEVRENVIDAVHGILEPRFGEHALMEPAPDSEFLHLQLA